VHPLRVESRRPNLSKVFDIAIGEAEAKDTVSESKRHPSKRRGGGLKGGAARAKKLSPYERRHDLLFRHRAAHRAVNSFHSNILLASYLGSIF